MTIESVFEARLAAVEARLHELEDERAIRGLLARYGYNADQGRSEEWVGLFAEDGAFDVAALKYGPDGPEHGGTEVIVRHEGHEALRAFILDPTSHKAIEGRSLHIMDSNVTIRIDGDSAIAESYNLTLVREGPEITLFNGSINRWTLVKRDGRWLIKECFRRRPQAPGFDTVLVTAV